MARTVGIGLQDNLDAMNEYPLKSAFASMDLHFRKRRC